MNSVIQDIFGEEYAARVNAVSDTVVETQKKIKSINRQYSNRKLRGWEKKERDEAIDEMKAQWWKDNKGIFDRGVLDNDGKMIRGIRYRVDVEGREYPYWCENLVNVEAEIYLSNVGKNFNAKWVRLTNEKTNEGIVVNIDND